MESPLARKVPHCRACGLPRKGHPRGLCGSPGSTPERERSSSMTPQPAAASPKPLMPGRFSNQRPSEVFVETPLLDRIGPKVEDVVDVDLFQPDVRDGPKQEEEEDGEPGYGLGLGRGLPPLRAQQGALGAGVGLVRQRYPTTPLRQMPTLLNGSMDTILPEHSISNARIHIPTRVVSAGADAIHAWRDASEAPSTASGTSTSLVSSALQPAPRRRGSQAAARNLSRAPSEASSDAPSLTWSDAIRETGAKPLAVLYAIPTRFGAYLQTKSRRSGADALVYPMETAATTPDNEQAVIVHGERDFLALIGPSRDVGQQEQRQRTPARSHRTATPSAHTPAVEPAPPVNQALPSPPSPHVVSHAQPISRGRSYFRNILYIFVGVFIGVSLTFYFLLRLDFKDDGHL